MSRDITPTQSRVPVFVLARLCANTEIGVPRGRIVCLRRYSCTHRHHRTLRCPCTPRHSCEGRNLNQGMDVLICILS